MKEYAPKPIIEEHYHIQELIDAQQKRADDRNYFRDREKLYAERMDEIKEAKSKDIKEFWCKTCSTEFFGESIKEVEIDWTNSNQYIAFYRSKCPQGHWCIRHITDRFKDSFFYRSKRIARDRGKHFAATVQPNETNYQLLYGRKNANSR